MYLLIFNQQWGYLYNVQSNSYIVLPLSSLPLSVIAIDMSEDTGSPLILSTLNYIEGKFRLTGIRFETKEKQLWAHWIAICI